MKILITLLFIMFIHSEDSEDDLYDPVRITNAILGLKDQYPEGYPWTNDDCYIWRIDVTSPLPPPFCKTYKGCGCVAFAMLASDTTFGSIPVYNFTDKSQIRIGDILRVDDDTHSVIVIEDLGNNKYRIAEGNYEHSIHYGRVIDIEKSEFRYGLTRYPPQ